MKYVVSLSGIFILLLFTFWGQTESIKGSWLYHSELRFSCEPCGQTTWIALHWTFNSHFKIDFVWKIISKVTKHLNLKKMGILGVILGVILGSLDPDCSHLCLTVTSPAVLLLLCIQTKIVATKKLEFKMFHGFMMIWYSEMAHNILTAIKTDKNPGYCFFKWIPIGKLLFFQYVSALSFMVSDCSNIFSC